MGRKKTDGEIMEVTADRHRATAASKRFRWTATHKPVPCDACGEAFEVGDAVREDGGSLVHDVDCEHPKLANSPPAAAKPEVTDESIVVGRVVVFDGSAVINATIEVKVDGVRYSSTLEFNLPRSGT